MMQLKLYLFTASAVGIIFFSNKKNDKAPTFKAVSCHVKGKARD